MSDSFSLSSSSSSSLSSEAEPSSSRRPSSLKAGKSLSNCSSLNQSGTGSAGSGSAEGTPSRETISAAMDRYVTASKDGREAFHSGNLTDAAREFNEALDIELQTELECLYDTSIGLVSGLVRREVASRLQMHRNSNDTAHERCARILQQLRDTYEQAAEGTRGKKSSSPEWYLRMGAALIVINEWEKAKAVYTEGIATCKDKKRIKIALKNLIKMEQMTSYGEIPAEDQPDQKDVPASPKLSPAHTSSQLARQRSGTMEPASPHQVKQYQRGRTTSLSLEKFSDKSKSNGHSKTSTVPSPSLAKRSSSPAISKKEKRLSFSLFNFRRSSNAAGLLSSKSPSVTSPEEMEEWKECFEPTQCRVLGQSSLQPLAITHMRRLSSIGGEEDGAETDLDHIRLNHSYTCSVVQKSMVIDDDDSELEDED